MNCAPGETHVFDLNMCQCGAFTVDEWNDLEMRRWFAVLTIGGRKEVEARRIAARAVLRLAEEKRDEQARAEWLEQDRKRMARWEAQIEADKARRLARLEKAREARRRRNNPLPPAEQIQREVEYEARVAETGINKRSHQPVRWRDSRMRDEDIPTAQSTLCGVVFHVPRDIEDPLWPDDYDDDGAFSEEIAEIEAEYDEATC